MSIVDIFIFTHVMQGIMQIHISSACYEYLFGSKYNYVAVNHPNGNVLTVIHLLVPWSCSWSDFHAMST